MEHISELGSSLNVCFQWNKARITFFAQMLLALVVTRTVNLNKMACAIQSNAEQTSRYRRLQRFFAEFPIDFDMIAGFIFQLFFIPGGKWYLTIDRTNWQWGKSDINILTLAIAFKGIAIPIYWELLDKKGNSDTAERISLIQKFINRCATKRHSASSCKCCRESADPAHFVSSLGQIVVMQLVKRRQEKLQAVSVN